MESGGAMDRSQPEPSAGVGDRLSKLEDRVLGNILSFLPAKEAARAALLSSRWRHVFAAVHTISLEEPEPPIPDDDWRGYCDSPSCRPPGDPNAPPPFSSAVSAAIIARQRRRGAAPLRPLRVAMEDYRAGDSSAVDQWVSYAVQQAAPEGLDLRLSCRRLPCPGAYYELSAETEFDVRSGSDDDDSSSSAAVSTDDELEDVRLPRWEWVQPEYTVPRLLFSCAELRSLSLGSCRLSPPAAACLPSLVTLLLCDVPDGGADVERLIAGCPRLADLTLEACDAVTALTVAGGARLRRLALRCCHRLAAVAVDSSELRAFEYRGAVPYYAASFLTMRGGSGRVAYCKVHICGAETSNPWQLVHLFANSRHLHLESARLGSGFGMAVPPARSSASFSSIRHLEVRGCLPDHDAGVIVDAMSGILELAPNLEALSLAFHHQEQRFLAYSARRSCWTRTISGGRAQRALAKFLLCNAPGVDKLWCEFAEGPLWTQVQLMREIKCWLINKSASTHFA
ncbi:uncharacterized protein LOC120700838 [Panicum virgatum]|uniref:uncharacterized protein LOC120700838 n=1 Tax=Panicum virgatum TaxID=38727 RepID=UPI0019D5F104|nr:uncharacterized protein LOC120700838 [Panicum virgatum]